MLRHWFVKGQFRSVAYSLLVINFLGPEITIFKYEGGAGDTPPVYLIRHGNNFRYFMIEMKGSGLKTEVLGLCPKRTSVVLQVKALLRWLHSSGGKTTSVFHRVFDLYQK